MEIAVLGVPFDGCGPKFGSRLGPAAVRYAGLIPELAKLGHKVHDLGDLETPVPVKTDGHLHTFEQALPVYHAIRKTFGMLPENHIPLMIGGDHSLSMGSVSAALARYPDLTVLWIDAHGDINTPATSPSSNLHGMPLAALTLQPSGTEGIRHQQWEQILTEIIPIPGLKPSNLAYIGLRDLDEGEKENILALPGAFRSTMVEIDLHGIPKLTEAFLSWLRKSSSQHLWISFDVDVFDPVYAPGTGTMVRGGLTYREGHLLAELLCTALIQNPNPPAQIVGLDVVEVNPSIDQNNTTALTAMEWVASLFGKRILPEFKI